MKYNDKFMPIIIDVPFHDSMFPWVVQGVPELLVPSFLCFCYNNRNIALRAEWWRLYGEAGTGTAAAGYGEMAQTSAPPSGAVLSGEGDLGVCCREA
ncbi:hypothetical protein D3C81_1771720 [compost metagenome]